MRHRRIIVILIILSLFSCEQRVNVELDPDAGWVTGTVSPERAGIRVLLLQGADQWESSTDDTGIFLFESVDAGIYRLQVTAPDLGRAEVYPVEVNSGEGFDTGLITLSWLPSPLAMVSPAAGAINVNPARGITLMFREEMNSQTVHSGFHLEPEVTNLEMEGVLVWPYFTDPGPIYHNFSVSGDFHLGTTYTFRLDSTITTVTGTPLEFTLNSSFTTEPFRLIAVDDTVGVYGGRDIRIEFNGDVEQADLIDHLVISPDITLYFPYTPETQSYFHICPAGYWHPCTHYQISLTELMDVNHIQLSGADTFALTTEPFNVVQVYPLPGDPDVPLDRDIEIRLNYAVLHESVEPAVSLTPPHDACVPEINNSTSGGTIRWELGLGETWLPDTTYTVTIDTALVDFNGGPLPEPFSFSFHTTAE